MFWKRPPIRPLRVISVALLVITAIISIVPESPTPWPQAISGGLLAFGDALGLGP
jgi:hypothetical protein